MSDALRDGEQPCDRCNRPTLDWWSPDWDRVMGMERGIELCPWCFVMESGEDGWQLQVVKSPPDPQQEWEQE